MFVDFFAARSTARGRREAALATSARLVRANASIAANTNVRIIKERS